MRLVQWQRTVEDYQSVNWWYIHQAGTIGGEPERWAMRDDLKSEPVYTAIFSAIFRYYWLYYRHDSCLYTLSTRPKNGPRRQSVKA